jgi:cellulose synthase/poly-beta-1,6-N-acetylglucosamine synthase-like glycosyltransferase
VSFYSASAFIGHSLWFSVLIYLFIGICHVTFVALTMNVSIFQACNGNWGTTLDRTSNLIIQCTQRGDLNNLLLSQNANVILNMMDSNGLGEYNNYNYNPCEVQH